MYEGMLLNREIWDLTLVEWCLYSVENTSEYLEGLYRKAGALNLDTMIVDTRGIGPLTHVIRAALSYRSRARGTQFRAPLNAGHSSTPVEAPMGPGTP
jgi:hypothetical protein